MQPLFQRRVDLVVDGRVGLAQHVPPFAVPDDDVLAPDLLEHRGADLAGERPLLLVANVLGTERDRRPLQHLGDRRRATRNGGQTATSTRVSRHRPARRGGERLRLRERGVHLPVAGDELLARSSPCRGDRSARASNSSILAWCPELAAEGGGETAEVAHQVEELVRQQRLRAVGQRLLGAVVDLDVNAVGPGRDATPGTCSGSGPAGRWRGWDRR